MIMSMEQVWEAFSGKLKQFIRARVQDDATAEDILQDVFVKIHTHIDTLKDADRLDSWVYQITRNTIHDHYRATRPTAELPETLPAASGGDDDAAARALAPCLKPMVERLPEAYRQALILTEYEGLTQKAMGERLGLSLSGAKSRVQRAREQLKEQLLDCCHFQFDQAGRIIAYQPKCGCCANRACGSGCGTA